MNAFKVLMALLFVGAIAFTGCNKSDDALVSDTPDGEELFRALILMEGDLANQIDVFASLPIKHEMDNNPELRAVHHELGTKVISQIKTVQPSFFIDFEKAISSGDVYAIDKAMNEATQLYTGVLKTIPEYQEAFTMAEDIVSDIDLSDITTDGEFDEAKLKRILSVQKDPQRACSLIAVCVVWIWVAAAQDVAVALNVAAAVNVYAAAFAWTWAYGPEQHEEVPIGTQGHRSLQKDLLISQIAFNFAK